jgi:type III secretion protein L
MALAYVVRDGHLTVGADRAVLKAHEFAALADAAELAQSLRAAAELKAAEAQRTAEANRAQAYERGTNEAKAACAQWLTDTQVRAAGYLDELNACIPDVVSAVVRKIGLRYGSAETVADIAAEAMRELRNRKRLTVRVHPDNRDTVDARLHALKEQAGTPEFIDVQSDPDLDPFDCVLESDVGVVKAGLNLQLEAMQSAIRAALAEPRGGGQESGPERGQESGRGGGAHG